jgi:YVTN family beta-propeller protein
LVKVDILRQKVVDEFLIGKYHTPLMIKPVSTGDAAYILSKGWSFKRGWITLMDATSALPFETIATGHLPGGIDISPGGDRIYVVNEEDNNVSVVDLMEGRVIHEIPLEKGTKEFWPLAVAGVFDRLRLVGKRKLLIVSDYSDRKILFVSTESGQIIKTITLRYKPAFLDVSPDGDLALSASFQRGNYSILDLNDLSLKKKSKIKGQIRGACFASNSMIALSHYAPKQGHRVSLVSIFSGSKDAIPVDKWVDEITADSRGDFVYAASSLGGRIYKIASAEQSETSRPVEIIQIGGFPIKLKLDEKNDNLILPNYKSNKLGLYSLGDGKMLTTVDFQENIAELVVQP